MVDNNTIIFVAQEHSDDCVEKIFTTIGAYQKEMEGVYGKEFIYTEYSSLGYEDEFEDLDAVDLLTALTHKDSIWFLTKYRSVWAHIINEEQPIEAHLIKVGSGNPAHDLEVESYLDDDCLAYNMLTCDESVFRGKGLAEGELQDALILQSGLRDELIGDKSEDEFSIDIWDRESIPDATYDNLLSLFDYYVEEWSPCNPPELAERLEAIGVPKRCYAEDC